MLTDASLAFVPLGSPLSLVGANGQAFPTNPIDLLGVGVGQAPPSIIGNVATVGSPDAMGIAPRPELVVNVGAAAVGAGAQLNVQLQGAQDLGAGGAYQPGPWQTFIETGYLTVAQLTALTTIAKFPWVPPFPANFRPRYLRLNFQTLAGFAFTTLTIQNALVTTLRDDWQAKYAAKNFVA